MGFFTDNLATIIVAAAVALLAALVIAVLIRDRKKGKSCGFGCSSCPHRDACSGEKKEKRGKYHE